MESVRLFSGGALGCASAQQDQPQQRPQAQQARKTASISQRGGRRPPWWPTSHLAS